MRHYCIQISVLPLDEQATAYFRFHPHLGAERPEGGRIYVGTEKTLEICYVWRHTECRQDARIHKFDQVVVVLPEERDAESGAIVP